MKQAYEMYRNNVIFNALVSNSLQCLITKHLSCQDVLSAATMAVTYFERDTRTAENQSTQPTANNSAVVKCPHFENKRKCLATWKERKPIKLAVDAKTFEEWWKNEYPINGMQPGMLGQAIWNAATKAAVEKFTTDAREKVTPDCCDESKQDLRDWIECGFKFCPWCGRELRPVVIMP